MAANRSTLRKAAVLASGPALGALLWSLPLDLNPEAHRLSGLLAWVVAWWILEAIPLAMTSILAAALAVILGITDTKSALAPFADPVIFLFLGGFLLARGLEVHGTDRRIALKLLNFPGVRGYPRRSVIMILFVTGFLSMWLSNTATTVIMMPIALGIIDRVLPGKQKLHGLFLLSIAYSASIGGMGTPVGSPPNVVAIGLLEKVTGTRIGFVEWMSYGVPAATLLLVALAILVHIGVGRHLPASDRTGFAARELESLGPMSRGEISGLVAAAIAVTLWVVPDLLLIAIGQDFAPAIWVKKHFSEAITALIAAVTLFILPGKPGKPALSWREGAQIDWGTLLLFGGGLMMGSLIMSTGLGEVLGEFLRLPIREGNFTLLSLVIILTIAIFATEVMSNTACANLMVPLIIAAAFAGGADPTHAAIGAALGCSLAFMLPIATPPNAVAYGTGRIPIRQMVQRGVALNLISIVVLSLMICLRAA